MITDDTPGDVRDLLRMALSLGGADHLSHPGLQSVRDHGYIVSHRHDHGGLCEVWLGFDGETGRRSCLKVGRQDRLDGRQTERLLRHEARLLGELDGLPGIEPLALIGQGEATCLVLPWVDGDPLPIACADHPAQCIELTRDAIEKLAALHDAGVIHGDIKPEHLVVNGGQITLLDFGLAQRADDDALALTPKLAGRTPEYAAPELVEDRSAPPTPAADVYAMGRVIAEAAAGLSGAKARCLQRVAFRACLPDAPRRPATGRELLAAFDGQVRRQRWRGAAIPAVLAALTLITAIGASIEYTAGVFGVLPWSATTGRSAAPADSPWVAGFRSLEIAPARIRVLHQIESDLYGREATAQPSPTGQIAWVTLAGHVELWDPEAGSRVIRLPDQAMPTHLAWDEAGRLIASVADGRVWDLSDDPPRPIAHGDPRTAVIMARDGEIEGWSTTLKRVCASGPASPKVIADGPIQAIPVAGDTPTWIVTQEGPIEQPRDAWLLDDPTQRLTLEPGDSITSAFRSEAGQLVLGLGKGDILLAPLDRPARRFSAIAGGTIKSVVMAPDEQSILAASDLVYIIDTDERRAAAQRRPEVFGLILSLYLDPATGKLLVTTIRGVEEWTIAEPVTPVVLR